MSDAYWQWLIHWCNMRASATGQRQRIYHNRIGGRWAYWSTAASAGWGTDETPSKR